MLLFLLLSRFFFNVSLWFKLLTFIQVKNYRMFHDDSMRSFFRRLTFTPDGSFLLAPGTRLSFFYFFFFFFFLHVCILCMLFNIFFKNVIQHVHSVFCFVCFLSWCPFTCPFLVWLIRNIFIYLLILFLAGCVEAGENVTNTTYVFSRKSFKRFVFYWVAFISL